MAQSSTRLKDKHPSPAPERPALEREEPQAYRMLPHNMEAEQGLLGALLVDNRVSALWYGSLVTAFMMFFRLRLWIEHQGSDLAHRLDLKPWEAALLAPHLAWYHWEHHQWPAVPYWKLPALRKLVPGAPLVTLSSLIKFYRACPAAPSGHPQRMLSDRKVA